MARRRYTTAEAFALVASGEREAMVADSSKETCAEKIERNQGNGMVYTYDRANTDETWVPTAYITIRSDYYDPNEAEEPATEPQWRPCSKGFALQHPEESQVQHRMPDDTWDAADDRGVPWREVGYWEYTNGQEQYRFRTTAPPEPGHICEIPAGVTGIEVVTTDDRGCVKSSGTVRTSGKAGMVVFVEDPS